MPTSTSIHPFPRPLLPCLLSASSPAGGGVSLAGLGARQATSGLWRAAAPRPSPCSLAPAGVSSGSPACQSDLAETERKKKKIIQAAVLPIFTLWSGQYYKQMSKHWKITEWNFIFNFFNRWKYTWRSAVLNITIKTADSPLETILLSKNITSFVLFDSFLPFS